MEMFAVLMCIFLLTAWVFTGNGGGVSCGPRETRPIKSIKPEDIPRSEYKE